MGTKVSRRKTRFSPWPIRCAKSPMCQEGGGAGDTGSRTRGMSLWPVLPREALLFRRFHYGGWFHTRGPFTRNISLPVCHAGTTGWRVAGTGEKAVTGGCLAMRRPTFPSPRYRLPQGSSLLVPSRATYRQPTRTARHLDTGLWSRLLTSGGSHRYRVPGCPRRSLPLARIEPAHPGLKQVENAPR